MTIEVANPYAYFTDRTANPLDLGYVYIGQPGADPETTPQPVYWDAAKTIPAAQPLRTSGGYIVNGASRSRIYTDDTYSIRIRDRNGVQVTYGAFEPKPANSNRTLLSLADYCAVDIQTATAAEFTAAVNDAVAAAILMQGADIAVPKKLDGTAWLLNATTLGSNAQSSSVRLIGQGIGETVMISPGSACEDWITLVGEMTAVEGIWFQQRANLVSGAAIAVKPDPRTFFNQQITNNWFVGFTTAIRNDGGSKLQIYGNNMLNNETDFLNARGGVDLDIFNHRSLGCKYGVVIDGVSQPRSGHPEDPPTDHAEGVTLRDVWIAGIQANGCGVWLKESLWVKMMRVECLQLKEGAVGIKVDGTERTARGNSLVTIMQSYIEGSKSGAAIQSINGPGYTEKLYISHTHLGRGSWSPADVPAIKFLDIDEVLGLRLDQVTIYHGEDTGTINISNCSAGVIVNCDFTQCDGFVGSGNDIRWDMPWRDMPPGFVQETFSEYPQAPWRTFAVSAAATSGTLTSVTSTASAYRRDGKTTQLRFTFTVATNGTGSGALTILLPYNSLNTATGFTASVVAEIGGVRRTLAGYVAAGTNVLTITNADGTYPGADATKISGTLTFEAP